MDLAAGDSEPDIGKRLRAAEMLGESGNAENRDGVLPRPGIGGYCSIHSLR